MEANLKISNSVDKTEATYVNAAALNILAEPFCSVEFNICNSSSSFFPLLEASNSTGRVTNWNNSIVRSRIKPIRAIFSAPIIKPIVITI